MITNYVALVTTHRPANSPHTGERRIAREVSLRAARPAPLKANQHHRTSPHHGHKLSRAPTDQYWPSEGPPKTVGLIYIDVISISAPINSHLASLLAPMNDSHSSMLRRDCIHRWKRTQILGTAHYTMHTLHIERSASEQRQRPNREKQTKIGLGVAQGVNK